MALPKPARAPPRAPRTDGRSPATTPHATTSATATTRGHTTTALPVRDPWASAPVDRLPRNFHPGTGHHPHDAPAQPQARAARTRRPLFGIMVLGALGFGLGWLVSFYGWTPGVFLASDVGVPVVLMATMRGIAKITNDALAYPAHAKAAAGIARVGGWALLVYWLLGTLTNVLQLAIGISLGILAYQAYATRTRLAKAGFPGFGPAFAPMLMAIGAYIAYQVVRVPLGPVPGFDAMAAAGAFVAAIAIVHTARLRVTAAANLHPSPDAAGAALVPDARERRVLIALVVAYIFFRLFISASIPYGPIVEWFLVCIGVLFFAISAAHRIGTVPTRRSLPAPDKRIHVQRVSSLPDRQLAATEERISGFIERGDHIDWLLAHFTKILQDSGYDDTEIAAHVAPLARTDKRRGRGYAPAETMGIEARGRVIQELINALRTRRVPTGTLKADPRVQTTARRRDAAGA